MVVEEQCCFLQGQESGGLYPVVVVAYTGGSMKYDVVERLVAFLLDKLGKEQEAEATGLRRDLRRKV